VQESLLPHIETTITTGAITGADMAPPMGMSRTRAITAITVVDMATVIVIDVYQGGDRRKRRLPVERRSDDRLLVRAARRRRGAC
jgi:hypothetical protein